MVATRNVTMLVSKRRKEEDDNNAEEPLTGVSPHRKRLAHGGHEERHDAVGG
jgi:hypothetical protein